MTIAAYRVPHNPPSLDLRGSLKDKSSVRLIAEREDCAKRLSRSNGIHRRIRATTAMQRRARELDSRLLCEEPSEQKS